MTTFFGKGAELTAAVNPDAVPALV
jgi:hypothetical protein